MKKIKMKDRKEKIVFGKRGVSTSQIKDMTMKQAKSEGETVYKVWKHIHLRKEYPKQKPKGYFQFK